MNLVIGYRYTYFVVVVLNELLKEVTSSNSTPAKFRINRYFLQLDNVFDLIGDINSAQPLPNESLFPNWISQPLDHFNPLEDAHFYQKYISVQSPEPRSSSKSIKTPICICIGGDAAIQSGWLQEMFLAQDCINQLHGHLFLLEHRFYGDSIPKANLTLDNLRYLSVAQALEDVAAFIPHIRKQYKLEKNRLFVFGASYGGTLAALFRRKYPHLTDAAVALSAPMIRELHNKEYLPNVGKQLRKVDRVCFMQIDRGLWQAVRLMESFCSKKDYPPCEKIRQNLGLCLPLHAMSHLERRIFYGSLVKDFTLLAEYNGVLNVTLKNVCDAISHPDIANWSALDKLLAGDLIISQKLFQTNTRSGEADDCMDVKKSIICDYLGNTDIQHEAVVSGKRQRLWQSCMEFASFRTSVTETSKQHPFGGPDILLGSLQQDVCSCAFGDTLTPTFISERLRVFQNTFGPFISSQSFITGSRIIYTIGEDDPGLQRELKLVDKFSTRHKDVIFFKVKASSHCGEVFLKSSKSRRIKATDIDRVQRAVLDQLIKWI